MDISTDGTMVVGVETMRPGKHGAHVKSIEPDPAWRDLVNRVDTLKEENAVLRQRLDKIVEMCRRTVITAKVNPGYRLTKDVLELGKEIDKMNW